MNLSIVYRCQK